MSIPSRKRAIYYSVPGSNQDLTLHGPHQSVRGAWMTRVKTETVSGNEKGEEKNYIEYHHEGRPHSGLGHNLGACVIY